MEVRKWRLLCLLGLVALLGASMTFAQDSWAKKPFNQWSDEELKKFMTDSPWVKSQTMATSAPGANLDMGTGGGGGRGGGGGGGGGDEGGGGDSGGGGGG